MASREILGLVDWHLLVLFVGLFVVNDALASSGTLDLLMSAVSSTGVELRDPGWLFWPIAVLSNLVSNVPVVMLPSSLRRGRRTRVRRPTLATLGIAWLWLSLRM